MTLVLQIAAGIVVAAVVLFLLYSFATEYPTAAGVIVLSLIAVAVLGGITLLLLMIVPRGDWIPILQVGGLGLLVWVLGSIAATFAPRIEAAEARWRERWRAWRGKVSG